MCITLSAPNIAIRQPIRRFKEHIPPTREKMNTHKLVWYLNYVTDFVQNKTVKNKQKEHL